MAMRSLIYDRHSIRGLEDGLKSKLSIQAACHGRSMEQEAREILKAGLTGEKADGKNLAESIRRRSAPFDGVELQLPARERIRRPPKLAR